MTGQEVRKVKKLMIVVAAMLAAAPAAAYAENISVNDSFYISKPEINCDGEVIREFKTQTNYGTVDISLTAETIGDEPTPITVTAAFYKDGILSAAAADTQMVGETPVSFELSLDNTITGDENSIMKVFIWKDMEPYAEAAEIGVSAEPQTAEAADMEIIRTRIEQDSELYNTGTDPEYLLDKLGPDGKFTDIDYGYSSVMSTWEPSAVFDRVIVMCKAYYSEGNRWYRNEELKAAIDSVLNDWAENRYKSVNWWFNEIDVPQNLSQILLYPFDEDEPYLDTLKELALLGMPEIDESLPHKTSDTGGNLTDKLQTAIKIAAATRDAGSMKNIISYLLDNELSVFDHSDSGEGIMTDYTFHQHGSFFYNGSYGSVFCTGINRLLEYLEDTVFMVSDRALNAYADFILEGHSWFFKNSGSDFACFGRAISRNNGVAGSIRSDCLGAVNILTELPGIDRRQELLELKENRLSGTDNSTAAARHFYLSDMTVMHRPDYYIGVRTSSNRNINTEYMNGENSRAMFISDGTTVFLKDGEEYKNIFPIWDWSLIPGTTTEYLSPVPVMGSTYQTGTREFVGGVSDGLNAVSAMDYARRGVTAKKAYFLFDSGMTALGAGITGTTAGTEVRTTMNQCLQDGNVVYYNGSRQTISSISGTDVTNAEWVLHDGIGYYFPDGEDVTITAESRSGAWSDINSSQSGSTVRGKVFALYMSHGTEPQSESHAYTVLPSVSEAELEEYSADPSVSIIENTQYVQGVWSKNDESAGIVFWNRGAPAGTYYASITIPASVTGMSEDLVVEALHDPCLVMLNKTDGGWDMYISNPKNDTLEGTYIGINRRLEGENAEWDGEKTIVAVSFHQGNESGSTVKISLTE